MRRFWKVPRIIKKNIAKCLACDEVLASRYRDHRVECSCGNVAISGGTDKLLRNVQDDSFFEEMAITFKSKKHAEGIHLRLNADQRGKYDSLPKFKINYANILGINSKLRKE